MMLTLMAVVAQDPLEDADSRDGSGLMVVTANSRGGNDFDAIDHNYGSYRWWQWRLSAVTLMTTTVMKLGSDTSLNEGVAA